MSESKPQAKPLKPDGIHYVAGSIPGFNFPIYLDLKGPVVSKEVLEWRKLKKIWKRVGRINYETHNWCAGCDIKYPKSVYRCSECGMKVRTKPWKTNHGKRRH